MSELDHTPKKNKGAKLRRLYAIANIAALNSNAAESEHESQVLNDEYEPQTQPESQGQATEEDLTDDEPTPMKKQKTIKVPVREAINANRKEHEPPKAEKKVSRLIVIDWSLKLTPLFRFVMTQLGCAFLFFYCSESTMELILNHTTLFYYNISSTTKTTRSEKEHGLVANWISTQVS